MTLSFSCSFGRRQDDLISSSVPSTTSTPTVTSAAGLQKACFPAQALLQRLQRVLPQQAHKTGESQIHFVFRPPVCLCMCMHFCVERLWGSGFFQ